MSLVYFYSTFCCEVSAGRVVGLLSVVKLGTRKSPVAMSNVCVRSNLKPSFMPIQLKCSCGKSLSVRDELAGKAVKCPSCQAVLRIPAAGASAKPTSAKASSAATPKPIPKPQTRPPSNATSKSATIPASDDFGGSMDDLFNEAGFQVRTGKTCPSCYESIAPDAVLCTKCGFHLESGTRIAGHVAEHEDAQSGEAILKKAAKDLETAQKMQDKMTAGSGMPWWMLALILFMLVSVTGVGVAAVNFAKREEATTEFNAVRTLMMLGGVGISVVGCGALTSVLYRACMESVKEGLMSLFIPLYIFYYGFSRFESAGKATILAILAGAVGGGLLFAATMK
jgi:hypothetical protein